jgi:hypothetical protein
VQAREEALDFLQVPGDVRHAEEKKRAQARIPGWETWDTVGHLNARTYSARPVGADCAPPECTALSSLDAVVRAAREYEKNVAEHLAKARADLDETPPAWTGRHGALTKRVEALEGLQCAIEAR